MLPVAADLWPKKHCLKCQTRQDENESVRHLVTLGYLDPDEIAAQEAALRRQRLVVLRQAMDLNAQDRTKDAAVLLEKLTDENPDWPPPHQLLAEIHYRAGRWTEAQSHLDWLAYHGVQQPRLALIAGGIAIARRQFRAALEDLQYAAHVEPALPGVHTLLGTVFLRLRRLDAAENAFGEAAQRNPADARARDGLSAICLKRRDYDDAADCALGALEQDIRLASAHYHLGVALALMIRPDEALAAMETFARLAPTLAAPYRWLSRIAANQLNDPARFAEYQRLGREVIRKRRARSS